MFKGDSWGRKDVSWTPHFRVFLSIYLFWRRPRGRPTTCWITWGLFITSGLRTPWEPPRRSWRMWMGVKEVWTTPSGHRLVKCTKKKGYMNRSVSVLFCVLPSSGLKNVRCSLKSSKKKSQKGDWSLLPHDSSANHTVFWRTIINNTELQRLRCT